MDSQLWHENELNSILCCNNKLCTQQGGHSKPVTCVQYEIRLFHKHDWQRTNES